MKRVSQWLLLLLASVPPLQAQVPGSDAFRRFEIGWNVISYSRQGSTNLYGGDLSFAVHLSERVGIAADLAVHVTPDNPQFSTVNYRFGPRFYARPIGRFTPFGEILAGGSHGSVSVTTTTSFTGVVLCLGCGPITTSATLYANGFALAAGGGLDMRIKPWFAWRAVQSDYSLVRALGETSHGIRMGTGIVFRFGS
jgi:hypothetical protein